jgi:molecular chaperone IbpA
MNTVFDVAPLWRSGIGFDHLTDLLGHAAKVDQTDKYPPYDIEKTGEDVYRLTLALAGWKPDEITLITEPNVLVVSGQKADPENDQYLYRGIPAVAFERRFNLADYVEVSEARLQNGLLIIELVRKVPEEKKPRRIAIGAGCNEPKTIEHQAA